jgi:2-polyprenyl-6-methoxyphenol hydroxylase-like FAD-dependent oxidoreductase
MNGATVDQRTVRRSGNSPVLVVGAGPVGAVLALELAHHGVKSIIVDRSTTVSRHPKMDYLNGRSMELLRRLGLDSEIRARGVAPQYPFNFIWSRNYDEPPIAVWSYSSVRELTDRIGKVNDGTMPAEAHQRLQGSLLEEILRDRLRAHPLVDFRAGWSFHDLEQVDGRLQVQLVERLSGDRHIVDAAYLVGCDGANGRVRQRVGIGVQQVGPTTQHRDVFFRSGDPVLRRHGRAFLTIAATGLTLVSRDEKDTWTGTVHLADERLRDEDPVTLMRKNLGTDFRVDEVLNIAEWEGRLAVAERYRAGAVFIAGDAAHQFYPIGGHGANTGIADAVDLGWKLASVVKSWGGPGILDSYEAERRPVALFNREMCANLLEVWLRFTRLSADGASRERLAGFLEHETYQLDNLGIHFGYRYDSSPIVCHEAGPGPRWEWGRIPPSTWPGARAPSIFTAGQTQVLDLLGKDFTLVDLSDRHAGKDLAAEANERGIPMRYLPVGDNTVREHWERNLVLIRPDQHVAWRSDRVPDNWDAVLERVTGR